MNLTKGKQYLTPNLHHRPLGRIFDALIENRTSGISCEEDGVVVVILEIKHDAGLVLVRSVYRLLSVIRSAYGT
jgi:hypothetical protein